MTDLRNGLLALRELGPSALSSYAAYRFGLSTGRIQRLTRAAAWEDEPLERWVRAGIAADPAGYADYRASTSGVRFFFDPAPPGLPWRPEETTPVELLQEADDVTRGRFRLFGGPPLDLGFPPPWRAFPPPLADRPPLRGNGHWSTVALDEEGTDVRLVWELSRFGWVFPLARAYRWTGEPKYAETCWRLIDDWRAANPPNQGVHWASAQEVGLRIVALAFAERMFLPLWREHPEILQRLGQLVAVHAARIPPTLAYARAQDNNHLISEATGLFTAGLLFPELRDSGRWRELGRRLLVSAFDQQVFGDGGYIQHSTNYQRLALSLGVWSARLAECNKESFPARTLEAIARLARSLAAQAHPETGQPPSFGPDDSSQVLPLASVAPEDIRPIVSAASRLALGETWFPSGPWDEASLWFGIGGGERSRVACPVSLPDTGLYYLAGTGTRGSLRCVKFHERPGHSDQLHVDLWWGGRLLAFDPGSYLYNGPPPWRDGLSGTTVHNAPMVDGAEPMRRSGRFLWTGRAQGRLRGRWKAHQLQAVRGDHDGYRRFGVTVSRTVALIEERAWIIEDVARGTGSRRLTVGWNLRDGSWKWEPGEVRVSVEAGELRIGWDAASTRVGLARGGEWVGGEPSDGPVSLWGWRSPRYSVIEPCLRLVLEVTGECPLRLRTRLFLGGDWPASLVAMWQSPEALDRVLSSLRSEEAVR